MQSSLKLVDPIIDVPTYTVLEFFTFGWFMFSEFYSVLSGGISIVGSMEFPVRRKLHATMSNWEPFFLNHLRTLGQSKALSILPLLDIATPFLL
jgi:hypothetical protein